MSLEPNNSGAVVFVNIETAEFAFQKRFFLKTTFANSPLLKFKFRSDGKNCVQAKQNSFLAERFGKTKEVFNVSKP